MFLRRHTRTCAGKQLTDDTLVDRVRTAAGPRQQVVAHLGERHSDQERRWQRTVTFYNRQGEVKQRALFPEDDAVPLPDDPDSVRIRLDAVGWTNGRRFGDVWLAWWLWRWLKRDELVARHVPQGKHTIRPADLVAIEVSNRLCAPCSEFALAEHWYASTGREDLLGVPEAAVTKDRLCRTLEALRQAHEAIANDLQAQLGSLFRLEDDLLRYDLTRTSFEGLAEDNDLAKRGYARDHRSDGKPVVVARVVTREGFPLAHATRVGNTRDVQTVQQVVRAIEKRFGTAPRVWVRDRGMLSDETLAFLSQSGRRSLRATRRSALAQFQKHLQQGQWQRLQGHPDSEGKLIKRRRVTSRWARRKPRRKKERALRRRPRRALARALRKRQQAVAAGRLKKRDPILERVGRLQGKSPKATPFVTLTITARGRAKGDWSWNVAQFQAALAREGCSLLRSKQGGWSAAAFWETYVPWTVVEHAFRVRKSQLLLRPVWHHESGRVQAHVFLCVLAYALWKTLDHLAKQAGLQTEIRKPDPKRPQASPKDRPMTPEVILREWANVRIGDLLLETTEGQPLALRRVARPNAEPKRLLAALQLMLPERLSPDRLL
jgi:transposase